MGNWGTAEMASGTTRPGDQLSPPLDSALDLGPNRTALEVSAGHQHTCAILDTGDVKCWGKGDRGQLGSGAEWLPLLHPVLRGGPR